MKKKSVLLLLLVAILFSSCFKDNDDEIQVASTLDIQNFIYRGLNFFYLYKADTDELANDYFANDGERNAFLESKNSPEELFDYLRSPQDRFSILVDDYVELINALDGITLNNGMEFGLVFYPDGSGNVFGYVRYVLPNSDASNKGVTRGMIFNTIGGQQINENNFSALLSPDTYTIGLANFDGTTVSANGESIDLVKSQLTENPVHIVQTLTVQGQKIGYLMYNAFTQNFDSQLNAAFAQFQADNVTDLILDLRYNGGGSVDTAIGLAGMITGQFNGSLYVSEEWNEDRQAEFSGDKLFTNTLENGEQVNSLNLTRVHVITSGRSASASELVINGLDPYINVIQVGDVTTGKFQASFLLFDAPAPYFARSAAHTGHTYAMLPLVFKTVNANGVTDFVDGLVPDISVLEDYSNLGALGEVTEPLLAAALNEIVPSPMPQTRTSLQFEEISESKANSPLYQLMIAEQ